MEQQTVNVLDQFYGFNISVPANEYDVVYTTLTSIMTDQTAAKNFASNLFIVANLTGVPVMKLLEDLKAQDAVGLTATMAYYVNLVRSNSALIGVSTVQSPNFYAARNVMP